MNRYAIKDRLILYIESISINRRQFEKRAGLANGYINNMKSLGNSSIEKIKSAFPDLNMSWLLTGEGEMLRAQERMVKLPADTANVEQRNYNSPGATMFATNVHHTYNNSSNPMQSSLQSATDNVRPLIPMSLYKQPNIDVYEKIIIEKKEGVELVPYFAGFSDYQLYMEVQDEAMLPDFKVGDRVAISAMPKNTYILNGNIYAIDTLNHGLFIRILIDRDHDYECQSTNNQSRYVTFRVPKSDVIRIYRVMGLIRTCI